MTAENRIRLAVWKAGEFDWVCTAKDEYSALALARGGMPDRETAVRVAVGDLLAMIDQTKGETQ